MIERLQGGQAPGRCQASASRDLVWVVAAASDDSLDLAAQTAQALATLEANLLQLGSDKTRLLSAQVFIADIDAKPVMDEVWRAWIGDDPAHWPQRACVGVDLGGNWLVEITVTALRDVDSPARELP